MQIKKHAILSMDIEDWYHLDYIKDKKSNYKMLDGFDNYVKLLNDNNVYSSFFVLGEIANSIKNKLINLNNSGHDIASHGWDHKRPLLLTPDEFKADIYKSKAHLEDLLGSKVEGYRAPCFSLDRARLDIVKNIGYNYDSSRIDFGSHPLYGNIDLSGFHKHSNNISYLDDFFEFEVSTYNLFNKKLPISGGGYIRILPWLFMKRFVTNYLNSNELYVFFIHPFEMSDKLNPNFNNVSLLNKFRFYKGRSSVSKKLNSLIQILKYNDFEFTTFSNLRAQLINSPNI
jgi:polysaccharide deacetylase family protein (PEP-CTERM system associated)